MRKHIHFYRGNEINCVDAVTDKRLSVAFTDMLADNLKCDYWVAYVYNGKMFGNKPLIEREKVRGRWVTIKRR